MFLLTKDNISEKLLVELVGTTVLLDSKFGIKQIVVEPTTVSSVLGRSKGSGKHGYIFMRVQDLHLLRSDNNSLILHGTAEDMVRFIKTEDYALDGEGT